MCALRLLDAAPAEVVLLGVQPASTDWGTILTPDVFPAQQTLMHSALEQLTRWKAEVSETAACRISTPRHEREQTDYGKAIWNTY
jgi:hydrogenase maturation protease